MNSPPACLLFQRRVLRRLHLYSPKAFSESGVHGLLRKGEHVPLLTL